MKLPTLFFDIETIPAGDMPPVELPRKPLLQDVKVGNRKGDTAEAYANQKLPELIDKWMEECELLKIKNEEDFKKRAVNSLTAQIVCLGYALDDERPEVFTGTEEEIISAYDSLLNSYGHQKISIPLVGHNIMEFDIPLIFHRAIKYKKLSLINYIIQLNDYQGRAVIYDTMQKWNLMSYRKYTKLDDIALFLGISGKGEIDGSKVWDLWKNGKRQEIFEYCKDDIELTRNVYKRMKSL
jgi:3'-5' exonuclease